MLNVRTWASLVDSKLLTLPREGGLERMSPGSLMDHIIRLDVPVMPGCVDAHTAI